jgi:hypothetical protein
MRIQSTTIMKACLSHDTVRAARAPRRGTVTAGAARNRVDLKRG